MYKGSSYLAAVGTIRALEARLLREAEVEKILGTKSFKEAFEVLHDLSFGEFISEVKTEGDFETVLKLGLYDTKIELTRLAPYSTELDVLWLMYDLLNIKILLKGKLLKDDPQVFSDMTIPYAKYSPEKLLEIINGETLEESTKWIGDAFQKAIHVYEKNQDPLAAEYSLDADFMAKILELALKQHNQFVTHFVHNNIDAFNIMAAFRFLLREDQETVPFLTGGNISQDDLSADAVEVFADNIHSPWKEGVKEGVEGYQKYGHLSILENRLSEVILESFLSSKFIIDGPEPLMAFFWRKKHNADILRTLLVGKRAGMSEEKLRVHLSKVY